MWQKLVEHSLRCGNFCLVNRRLLRAGACQKQRSVAFDILTKPANPLVNEISNANRLLRPPRNAATARFAIADVQQKFVRTRLDGEIGQADAAAGLVDDMTGQATTAKGNFRISSHRYAWGAAPL